MKSVLATLVAATLAGLTNAVQFTNSQYAILSSVPFTLTWSDASGPVTITLKTGSSTDLKDVEVLTSGATGSSFTWTPPATLASSTYAFEIKDSTSTPNYSPQFTYAGSAGTVTAASTSLAVTSTAISTTVSTGVSKTSASTISSLVATTVSSNTTATNQTTTASSSSASVTAASNSTTSASTTSSSKTTSSSASKTSSSATSSTSAPNSNGAGALVMPFALPMLIAAGVAYLN